MEYVALIQLCVCLLCVCIAVIRLHVSNNISVLSKNIVMSLIPELEQNHDLYIE